MTDTIESIKQINRQSVGLTDQWLNQLRYIRINCKQDAELQEPAASPEIVFVSIPEISTLHAAHPGVKPPKFVGRHPHVVSPEEPANAHTHALANETNHVNATPISLDETKSQPMTFSGPVPAENKSEAFAHSVFESHSQVVYGDFAGSVVPPGSKQNSLHFRPATDTTVTKVDNETATTFPTKLANPNGKDEIANVGPKKLGGRESSEEEVIKLHDSESHLESRRFSFANVENNPAIEQIVDRIVHLFPGVAPVVLMFVGTDDHPRNDSVCAKVAGCLASRETGSVLLVDANVRRPRLTMHESMNERQGFTDVLRASANWIALPERTHLENLEFLPRGQANYSLVEYSPSSINKIVSNFKDQFTFTVINAGLYADACAREFGNYCDATYLVLSLTETDQIIAVDAVSVLRETGARISGCVATKEAA
jgi:hypothetical protein